MEESLLFQRLVGDCFYLIIPNEPQVEVRQAIRDAMVVERAVKAMIRGSISPDELLEMVEPVIEDMDDYINELEENLAEISLV